MSAHFFSTGGSSGIIHLSDIYRFKGVTFEFHRYLGPILCRKDGEPAKRQPGERSKFWKVVEAWERLSIEKREKTRIYG